MKNVWTKKNVEKMTSDELIKWNNHSVKLIEDGKRLEVSVPASEKVFKLVQAEMKKRKMI